MRDSTLYKIAGTKFLRLASSQIIVKKRIIEGKTIKKGWGSNLQNKEKKDRQRYIPDEGKILVQTDQSGAEALIVAYICRDGNYRALFKNGIKPHTYICCHLPFAYIWPKKLKQAGMISDESLVDMREVARIPIPQLKQYPYWKALNDIIKESDNWPSDERYYYLGKQTEHSSNYDVGASAFRMNILDKSGGTVVISKEDAESFLAVKHGLYPEIREDFHAYVKINATRDRRLYNLHGEPIEITKYEIKDQDWKELYAAIPQSTVAQITRRAYITLQAYIEKTGKEWDLLGDTHDSLFGQCPIAEALEFGRAQKLAIEQTFISPYDGKTQFQMKSETVAGFNWCPYNEQKNPLGLKEIKV